MPNYDTWYNDLYPIINKRVETKVTQAEKIIGTLISIEQNKAIDYRIDSMGGYGLVPEIDGTEIQSADQKRGYTTIVTPKERGMKVPISLKYANVDLSGEARRVGERLGESMKITVFNDFLLMFQRAYDSNYAFADGLAWAATNHKQSSDSAETGTYQNLITNALSIQGIEAADKLGARYKTADGLPAGIIYDLLLVSPELKTKAMELLGPTAELSPEELPETAENGANPFYKMRYYVIGAGASGFTSKQWGLASSELLKQTVKLVYIQKPITMMMKETPIITNYYVYADYNFGFAEPRAVIFSNPT